MKAESVRDKLGTRLVVTPLVVLNNGRCAWLLLAVNNLMWPAADCVASVVVWLKLQIADSANVACVVVWFVETENM